MKFYRDKKATNFQVGLFTLIGLIILIVCYFWLTEVLENRNYTQMKVEFANAGNTQVGSPVTINGVKKGRVEEIIVKPDGIILLLKAQLDFPLSADTHFFILESTLMGDVQVDIRPGSSEELLDFTTLHKGKRRIGLSQLVSELGSIVSGMQSVLAEIDGKSNLMEDLQSVLVTTEETMQKFGSSIDKNSAKTEHLLSQSLEITAKLNRIVTENESDINQTVSKTSLLITQIDQTMQNMQQITSDLQIFAAKINEKETSFNKLISERDLYDNLLKTTAQLDSLLVDIKKNPQKYFQIKVF